MASLAGTQIDKYDMIEEVGHGGMAVVYRGLDRVLKREVAVKVLHPHLADRKESRLRLEREAIAVAQLRHENILEIFDYSGPGADESYIVTEFIHGMTLKDWVDEKLDPRPAVAAMIVHRLCLALGCAHREGIVHRDIKPENVMIRRDGVLKLMDFGIAQIIDNQKLTLTGQLIGSPAYMAPELISGKPLDRRTDLFSLGILLYQLATGQLPFCGRNPHEVLNRIADGDYPPAATICPLVDRELEDIIALALASDPDERYQSVETFGQELGRYLEDVGIEADNAELAAYFAAPDDYVVELDERICVTLTKRAREAAADGETSRAIRLLGRVLEIDVHHPGATTLLQKLQRRERRNRTLAMIVGATAAAAAVVLLWQYLPRGDAHEQPTEVASAAPSAASLERSPTPSTPTDTPPAGDPAGPTTTPSAEAGTEPAGPAGQDDAAVAGDDPSAGQADTAAEAVDSSGGTGSRPTPRVRRPPRLVDDTPPTVPCTIAFSGIPLPTARNLHFNLGADRKAIDGMQMQVELAGDAQWLNVKNERFLASHRVRKSECLAGPVDVVIRPRAARVTFEGLPDDGVAIVCKKGCREDLIGDNQLPRTFQSVPIPKGELTQAVTIVVKHPDYKERTITKVLQPGPNMINVTMIAAG